LHLANAALGNIGLAGQRARIAQVHRPGGAQGLLAGAPQGQGPDACAAGGARARAKLPARAYIKGKRPASCCAWARAFHGVCHTHPGESQDSTIERRSLVSSRIYSRRQSLLTMRVTSPVVPPYEPPRLASRGTPYIYARPDLDVKSLALSVSSPVRQPWSGAAWLPRAQAVVRL